jgi:SAM-dependent methyltransferase
LAYFDEERSEESPVALLGTLFMLGGQIRESAFVSALSAELREILERHSLVTRSEADFVRSTITLIEQEGLFFLSDRMLDRTASSLSLTQSATDHVDPPNYSALALRRRVVETWPNGGGRLLDIGCGTGFHGLLMAKQFADVDGIDITPRCLAFSTVNARLNRARASFFERDVFEFEPTAAYDAIVFNSPTLPRYKSTLDKIDTYDPPGGHLVIRFLSTRLPTLLARDGTCTIWTVLRVPYACAGIADLLQREVAGISELDVRVLVENRSPFRLSRQDIANQRVPRGSFLLADPNDAPELLGFVRAEKLAEILPVALIVTHRKSTAPKLEVETIDPGLYAD